MPTLSPLPCSYAAMTRRASSEVVLLDTGSYPGQSYYFNTTFTRSGGVWTKVSTSDIDQSGPLPLRSRFDMAYDGTTVVLFGGKDQAGLVGALQDHWSWNGTVWAKVTPATVPFGRFGHKMAFLSGTGAVMFGGQGGDQSAYLQETWVEAAGAWTQQSPTTPPPGRVGHVMAGSASIILMGCGQNTNSCLNDFYSFSAGQWTKLTTTGTPPSVRSGAAMAYDTGNTVFVLFGGKNESGIISPETYTSTNGIAWTKQSPSTTPSAREGAQMAFDGTNCILFGGNGLTEANNELWKWDHSLLNWVLL